jgi:hypothetical protein
LKNTEIKMTITPKLQAEYVELANQYLDHLPVENVEQARLAAIALRTIADQQSLPSGLASSLQGRVESIKELLDSPEMYAKPEDVKEFKSIIMARVASKISELEALSQQECERIGKEQRSTREEAEANRARMAQAAPPAQGSAAHVVSEEEALLIHFGLLHEDLASGTVSRPEQAYPRAASYQIFPMLYVGPALRSDGAVVFAAIRVNAITLTYFGNT